MVCSADFWVWGWVLGFRVSQGRGLFGFAGVLTRCGKGGFEAPGSAACLLECFGIVERLGLKVAWQVRPPAIGIEFLLPSGCPAKSVIRYPQFRHASCPKQDASSTTLLRPLTHRT